MKITIDPGHSVNMNAGCIKGYFEGNTTFALAGYLKTALEQYEGFSVVLTRSKLQENPSLEERGKTAISSGSDVFISLHTNAASTSARGVVAFHSLKRPDSKILSEQLAQVVAQTMGTYSRGSLTRLYPGTTKTDYYGVIRAAVRGSDVPYAFILEHGFHTNPIECAWLNHEVNLRKLAEAEAATFAAYFGAVKKELVVKSDTTQDMTLKLGSKYTVKLTAKQKPNFTVGNGKVLRTKSEQQLGDNYYLSVTATGKVGEAAGVYANGKRLFTVKIT